jgi:MFS family permease
MIVTCLVGSVFIWPIAYTSSWPLLMLFVTLAATGVGGCLGLNAVYMTEIVAPSERSKTMLGSQIFAGVIAVFVGGYPALYLLPGQLKLYVFIFAFAPTVIVVPLIAFGLPESPRWLESKGRTREADEIVSRLESAVESYRGPLVDPVLTGYDVPVSEKVPVGEIFRGVYLRRSIVLLVIWVLGYMGLDYGFGSYQIIYLVSHKYSAHLVFLISIYGGGAGIIVGTLVGAMLGERVERRVLVFIAGIMSCVGALGYGLFPSHPILIGIATFFGSGAVLVWAFNMYNYTAVAFPTRLRSVGTGWTDGLGHVGAMFGPAIAGVFYNMSSNHVAWYIWFAVVGGLVPGTVALLFGMRQSDAILEEVSR